MKSLHVLIVEDSEDDAMLFVRELRARGIEPVFKRVDTAEALRVALNEGPWDVALVDYHMPSFGAAAALKLVKELMPYLPFILVSGHIRDEQVVAMMRAGASDFLPKDNLSRLIPAIERELREAETRRQHKRVEALLRSVVEGTAAATGPDFMRALVRSLATVFKTRYAFVGELVRPGSERIRTLAVWAGDKYAENFEYPLAVAPCRDVVGKVPCYYPENTWRLFPEDSLLKEMAIECYLGAPLFGLQGNPLGLIAVMNDRPVAFSDDEKSLFNVFAARAGAELERLEKDTALKTSEGRFRALLEFAPDAMVIVNRQGEIILANAMTQRLFGYAAEELSGHFMEILLPERFRSRHPEQRAGYMAHPHYRPMGAATELFGRRKDGSEFPVEISLSPIETPEGLLVASAIRDISERKRTEQEINTLVAEQQSIFDNSGVGIAFLRDRPIARCNRFFAGMFGYEANELIGLTTEPLYPSKAAYEEQGRQAYPEVAAGGSYAAEVQARRKDGTLFWASYTLTAIDCHDLKKGVILVMRDITERKRYEGELEHQANYDTLTDLPNRNLMRDRIRQAIAHASRAGRIVALLFLDLDRFKIINDSLGHKTGDLMLQSVARKLSGCVREGDTVARLGGDEFLIVLADMAREDDVSRVTRKLLDAIAETVRIEAREFVITGSVGISLYPIDSDDPDVLTRNADSAMYRAKELGRNRYEFYAAEMNVRALEKLALESSLRRALEKAEFRLHYQPKVDLRTGQMTGVEALLRWDRPGHGLVSPGDFIPLLEETGLIVPTGDWVLRAACAQIRAWRDAGLPPLRVAVNLSGRQLQHSGLNRRIKKILDETGIQPELLELEITESFLMADPEEAINTLSELKELGIRISIDDFGTGYSSLGYLKRFPIDSLKIDRSFVKDLTIDPDDAAIVMAVIGLAHNLHVKVIAEGVETEGQLEMLARNRCDEMQGYFFSKPLPADVCTRLLEEGRILPVAGNLTAAVPTVLLVDDETDNLLLLSRSLGRDGYRILTASSALQALEILAVNAVGVVLSDYNMPGMDGIELLRRVKELYPEVARIMVSGQADLGVAIRAINEGAIYKFLPRSWNDEQLRISIAEAFRAYELVLENKKLVSENIEAQAQLTLALQSR